LARKILSFLQQEETLQNCKAEKTKPDSILNQKQEKKGEKTAENKKENDSIMHDVGSSVRFGGRALLSMAAYQSFCNSAVSRLSPYDVCGDEDGWYPTMRNAALLGSAGYHTLRCLNIVSKHPQGCGFAGALPTLRNYVVSEVQGPRRVIDRTNEKMESMYLSGCDRMRGVKEAICNPRKCCHRRKDETEEHPKTD